MILIIFEIRLTSMFVFLICQVLQPVPIICIFITIQILIILSILSIIAFLYLNIEKHIKPFFSLHFCFFVLPSP